MDPVSHAAFGRILIAVDRQRRLGRGALAAGVLGALAPDLDLGRALQGWDVYLRAHQAGTHSIAGALGCGLLAGASVRLFTRAGRLSSLALAGTIGALSHLLLDLIAGADLGLFWPIASASRTLPLFAMADPWLIGFFVVAVLVLWRRPHSFTVPGILLLFAVLIGVKGLLYRRAIAIDRTAAASRTVHAEAVFASWRRWISFTPDLTLSSDGKSTTGRTSRSGHSVPSGA